MSQNPESHHTRRIVLPSGRAINIVGFIPPTPVSPGLQTCPDCRSELVQPLRWHETEQHVWQLLLGCPNCGWQREDVFSQKQVDRFEEHLDRGVAAMLNDLRRLTQANMAEEIDRFVRALEADLLLPEDF